MAAVASAAPAMTRVQLLRRATLVLVDATSSNCIWQRVLGAVTLSASFGAAADALPLRRATQLGNELRISNGHRKAFELGNNVFGGASKSRAASLPSSAPSSSQRFTCERAAKARRF